MAITNLINTLTIVLLGLSNSLATDYCKPGICWNGPHPACNNPGGYGPDCGRDVELIDMKRYKKLILKEHNRLRQQTASGKLNGFPPAQAMPALRWNNELSYVAEFNVKTCKFHHDCGNTDKFPSAGQNIFDYPEINKNVDETLKFMVQNWFDEYKESSVEVIRGKKDPYMEGHFLGIVGDQNTHIGCSATRYTKKQYNAKFIYLVCNLSKYHVNPVYKEGPAGSKCKKRSKSFPALCA